MCLNPIMSLSDKSPLRDELPLIKKIELINAQYE